MEKEFKPLQIAFISVNKSQTGIMLLDFIKENKDDIETVINNKKIILKDGTVICSFYFLDEKSITCNVKIDQVLIYADPNWESFNRIYVRYKIEEFLKDSCLTKEYRYISCE